MACHTQTPLCKYRRGRVLNCPLLQMKAWSQKRELSQDVCIYCPAVIGPRQSCRSAALHYCRLCVCSGVWLTTGQPTGYPAGIRRKTVALWSVVDPTFTGNVCDTSTVSSYCSQTSPLCYFYSQSPQSHFMISSWISFHVDKCHQWYARRK